MIKSLALAACAALPGAALAATASLGTQTLLHSFGCTTAGSPRNLVPAADGGVYGQASAFFPPWNQTLFHVTPDGGYSVVARFGVPGTPTAAILGLQPLALLDGGRLLYSAVSTADDPATVVLYSIAPDGQLTALHHFAYDPGVPSGISQAVLGHDGLVYGISLSDGDNGLGTLFRMAQDGSGFTVLHSYTADEGSGSGLVQLADGRWFGISSHTAADYSLHGRLFQLDPASGATTTLHSFDDGVAVGGLIAGAGDRLYGSLQRVNSSGEFPENLFRIASDGSGYQESPDVAFRNATNIGAFDLAADAEGRIFASGSFGGPSGNGALYQVIPTFKAQTVFSFDRLIYFKQPFKNGTGSWPWSLVNAPGGGFYGATEYGGQGGPKGACGAVYRYLPPGT